MKNTLKISLVVIGLGFLVFGFYSLFTVEFDLNETRQQLYAMLGVGALFVLAGLAMGRR